MTVPEALAPQPASRWEGARRRGPWLQAAVRFRRRPLGLIGLLGVLVFLGVTVLAPELAPYPAGRLFMEFLNRPQPPSLHGGHLLGTDTLGHDFLSQLLVAVRESLLAALACAAGATAIGVAVGALAGYYGDAVDSLLSWLLAIVVTMPALVVVLVVVVWNAPVMPIWFGVTLMLYLWTGVARVVRASVRSLRAREFVEAAKAAGASDLRIVLRHLLPNAVGPVIVAATGLIGQTIAIVATVNFFDLGTPQSDQPTLGGLIAAGIRGVGGGASPDRLWEIPVVVLIVLLVCVNLTGDALDEALNPRSRR